MGTWGDVRGSAGEVRMLFFPGHDNQEGKR